MPSPRQPTAPGRGPEAGHHQLQSQGLPRPKVWGAQRATRRVRAAPRGHRATTVRWSPQAPWAPHAVMRVPHGPTRLLSCLARPGRRCTKPAAEAPSDKARGRPLGKGQPLALSGTSTLRPRPLTRPLDGLAEGRGAESGGRRTARPGAPPLDPGGGHGEARGDTSSTERVRPVRPQRPKGAAGANPR